MDVWGWDFMEAALLFFGPFGAIAVVVIFGSIFDKASSNRDE